ncbi:MAG TPA: LD-carboxypeptidase [Bryobacteraceae bacterium]|nr:LD-carboxypeptidase [Bryobacteraceae bacterium]
MTRRTLLGGIPFIMSAQSASPSAYRKPKVLKPGDLIGLVTPASFVADPDRLLLVERTMKYFGLRYRFGKSVAKKFAFTGGTVAERVADLHDFFADPEVAGIFCIRGGYGSGQLLAELDYDLIRRNPKVLVGYSDITALHLAIHQKCRLVTFHGPVALSRFNAYTEEHFRRALFETKPLGAVTNPPDNGAIRPEHLLRTVRGGVARGQLIAGNLSLISALMGTPYEIDTRGKILCIEDVGEAPYRLDRMLMQLKLAGKLDAASGVVWGECADCRDPGDSSVSVGEVVDNVLGTLKVPVLSGLTIGHTSDQLTLPLGCMATLNADKGDLVIEESGVSA